MNTDFEMLRQLALGDAVDDTKENRLLAETFGLELLENDGKIQNPVPLELLDPEFLYQEIAPAAHQSLSRLDLHWTIESTNTRVMDLGRSTEFHGYACLAEQQTAGRGRRGRNWVSPFGKNIYLTLGWVMPSERSIEGLSLAVGTGVAAAIQSVSNTEIQLKWPNDVLIGAGKAAGILIEIAGGTGQERRLVIGVGINLQLSHQDAGSIEQPWSVVEGVSRNRLAAALISELVTVLEKFSQQGFEPFQAPWARLDAHFGQEVRLIANDRETVGISRGVDASGNLLLDTAEGKKTFNAGEVSLRATQ